MLAASCRKCDTKAALRHGQGAIVAAFAYMALGFIAPSLPIAIPLAQSCSTEFEARQPVAAVKVYVEMVFDARRKA